MSYLSYGEAELDWERSKFAPPPWHDYDYEPDEDEFDEEEEDEE